MGTRYVSDTWKCGSLSFIFTHPPEDKKKKKEKRKKHRSYSWGRLPIHGTPEDTYVHI